ncbi:hypothetical protein HPP92_012598 [Vanilla planifolia]|uniref:WRKY domain-containing protein n=1 Tax=Vanilla planifolia TaxID=51239 RepID=A0A835R587_VANPL|nr:hypothetical protein HPP92_012598 [Vanilla planifolia]
MEVMMNTMELNWLQSMDEEHIMQHLPLETRLVRPTAAGEFEQDHADDAIAGGVVPRIYTGPTIGDVERALIMTGTKGESDSGHCDARQPDWGQQIHKMDNRYTLKIKSSADGVAHDGLKWRKYGQKSIKNSPNPRSYYKCTNPKCNAKKQVERSIEDPETLIVTYEGLHLHYTYSRFVLSPKPKQESFAVDRFAANKARAQSLGLTEQGRLQKEDNLFEHFMFETHSTTKESMQIELPQGLLEDVVPLMVRKPCNS